MNNRKIKINVVLFFITIILFIILFLCINNIISSLKSDQNEVQVLDNIETYNYILNENDSKYFKSLFKELKDVLSEEKIDEEEYAKLITKLFITDFYSLSSALNKNDVGGIQFVYTDYQSDFIKKAKEAIYANVENNIYGKRKQKLPSVKEVKISNIEKTKFKVDNFEDKEAFIVDVEILYKENLDYQTNVTLTLVHSNDKLEIAKMK